MERVNGGADTSRGVSGGGERPRPEAGAEAEGKTEAGAGSLALPATSGLEAGAATGSLALPATCGPKPEGGDWRGWREFGRTLRDLVFPPSCVHCGGLVEASPLRHVCAACEPLIVRVRSPHCPCCGHPYFGDMEGERLCVHCEGLKPEFGEGKTTVLFRGPARALVHALKYRHGLHVLEDIATLVATHPEVADFVRGAVLVPVPLHPRKRRERGYNQSQLLAETIADAVGGEGTRVEELLRRIVDTQTQTNLDRAQRRANLKNAFALAPGAAITESQSYILIDDVFTTGSTLNACAAVLRRAGGLKVNVVTFGHG